ncbi:MAG TPA: ABC transporter permease [Terriglobales bacterium]|nr:ABC transporter permease [Terriglobales bacterium]
MTRARLQLSVFVALHCAILCAEFLAPYDPTAQNREFSFAPPTKVHWRDETGRLHARPFVYAAKANAEGSKYAEDGAIRYPIRFLYSAKPAHTVNGRFHLFGVESPAHIFLLGTDEFGRDVFSRLLYGGRVSIAAGLLATLISLLVGTALGAIAGMAGGATDGFIMRLTELGLALSWFYLLLGIRAFLPLRTPPLQTLFLIAGVLGLTAWARPARLVRGMVLTAKERGFVMCARGFGASEFYIFRRHLLPQLLALLLTQAIILIPQFIMAEVTLSFLGLGASEPLASWGNMLADLQQYRVLISYWWMATPILALVLFSWSYFAIMNILRTRVQFVAV